MKEQLRRATAPGYVFWVIVAFILATALMFRLPGIGSRSLWIDELYSQWFAARSFVELWQDVPDYETHPPLYYSLLKLWSMAFGQTELGLRSLSLVASLATVFVVAVSGRFFSVGALGDRVGLLAAALLAVSFANIRDAQNVRPYALQTLVCTVAIIAALALVMRLSRPDAEGRNRAWVAPAVVLGLSSGCSLWLHNTGLFISLGIWSGLALSLIFTPPRQRLRNLAIFFCAGCLALAIWAPAIPMFIHQLQAFSSLVFWLTPKPGDLYSAWILILGNNRLAFVLAIALLGFGLLHLSRHHRAMAVLAASILLLPLYSVLAVHFAIKPIYIQRLFAWMVPLALLVIAFGIVTTARSGRGRWLVLLAVLAAFIFPAAKSIEDKSRPIDDWKAIVAEIATHAQAGDVVITVAAEGSVAVGYYAERQPQFPTIVCIPGCYPQRDLPRTYISNLGAPEVIEADGRIAARALETYRRVWLVQVSVSLYDPKGFVRSTIARERTFVRYFGNSLAKVELFQ